MDAQAPSPQAAIHSPFLTIAQAAQFLNISIFAIRAWRRRGSFPAAYKFGRLVRFKVEDLERWASDRQERARKRHEGMVRMGEWFAQQRREKEARRQLRLQGRPKPSLPL